MPESEKRDSKMESEQGTGIGPQAPTGPGWPSAWVSGTRSWGRGRRDGGAGKRDKPSGWWVDSVMLFTHPRSQDQPAQQTNWKRPRKHPCLSLRSQWTREGLCVLAGSGGSFLLGIPTHNLSFVKNWGLGFILVCTKNNLFNIFLGWEYSQTLGAPPTEPF